MDDATRELTELGGVAHDVRFMPTYTLSMAELTPHQIEMMIPEHVRPGCCVSADLFCLDTDCPEETHPMALLMSVEALARFLGIAQVWVSLRPDETKRQIAEWSLDARNQARQYAGLVRRAAGNDPAGR